jgi:glyoxylase-like metal-dependent hydrolase (beta-lactamase superfamily II)
MSLRNKAPKANLTTVAEFPKLKGATSSLTINGVRIDRIIECSAPLEPLRNFLPSLTAEALDSNRHWMQPWALDGQDQMLIFIQSYVVRTAHHTILIDTCVGNDKSRPGRGFMDRRTDAAWTSGLAALGLSFEDIDIVMCTHLHVDHVGWNTRLENGRWEPSFPNARYLFSEKELAYWTAQNEIEPVRHLVDSVLPVIAAGRHQLVSSSFELDDQVRLLPTPGHTPDHFAVVVGKGRDDVVFTGDLFHSPIQLVDPDLFTRVDTDQALSSTSRHALLERYCGSDTICCTAHFPERTGFRINRWGAGFRGDAIE